MYNNNAMAYIPTQHRGKLSAADKHEYFGEDFRAGKSEFAIFKSEAGRHYCIWTYGTWEYWKLEAGQKVTFQHTQTFRQTEMEFVREVSLADFDKVVAEGNVSVVHWTLK